MLPWLAVVALLTVASGCYWLRYHDLLETHLGLMQGLANDAAEAIAAGDGLLQASDIERLRYPLDRARQFVAVSRRRSSQRASLERFESFVAAYAELVDELDRARVAPPTPQVLAVTDRQVARIDVLAGSVRDAIATERAD